MGLSFGRTSMSYTESERLARALARKGAGRSVGGAQLLGVMRRGQEASELCGEEAEQASRSLREAAGRMHGSDKEAALELAADAMEAANRGSWRIG